jgi:two-component system sensor histidine kinase AlgZ
VLALASSIAAGVDLLLASWSSGVAVAGPLRSAVVAGALAGCILLYFDWRRKRLSPALAKSRLAALQARIRPHFLFNSLNTAISVVRHDAVLAETVLLDMAELFRVVLAESRALVTLDYEIRIARAYLEIERARLGDRLRVSWEIDDVPMNAQMPVLLLQPLVENAVWHGIEPLETGGEIAVRIRSRHRGLEIEVRNPMSKHSHSRKGGNRLALANIEERLMLHFDAEAQLRAIEKGDEFIVQIRIPLQLDLPALAEENVPSRISV